MPTLSRTYKHPLVPYYLEPMPVVSPYVSKGAKVPLKRMNVALPAELFDEITAIVKSARRWLSEVDFVRNAAYEAVERYREEHPGPAGPEPGRLPSDDTKERRR